MSTIFALSTGAPPAGIAIIRVTGPGVRSALLSLAGLIPEPRTAARSRLSTRAGEPLDDGLILWFPGPASVTGEDVAEFHVHGGRAVISAVEAELGTIEGLRPAEPGEFTKRAFVNGRIDLAEAEGLADLLAAETELQRKSALAMASGSLSRKIEQWSSALLAISAQVEATLDHEDEDDVTSRSTSVIDDINRLKAQMAETLELPSAEALREGFRVAIAGPPNAGKSTLFNALTSSEAAIATPIPGTTRDVLVRSIAIAGVPFMIVDMAGIHEEATDPIERMGIDRARRELNLADIVLWLGPEGLGPPGAWEIEARIDVGDRLRKTAPDHRISASTGMGLEHLTASLVVAARTALIGPTTGAISTRQRQHLERALASLKAAQAELDLIIVAEHLRVCRQSFDSITGRTDVEHLLDEIFARFCIGK